MKLVTSLRKKIEDIFAKKVSNSSFVLRFIHRKKYSSSFLKSFQSTCSSHCLVLMILGKKDTRRIFQKNSMKLLTSVRKKNRGGHFYQKISNPPFVLRFVHRKKYSSNFLKKFPIHTLLSFSPLLTIFQK